MKVRPKVPLSILKTEIERQREGEARDLAKSHPSGLERDGATPGGTSGSGGVCTRLLDFLPCLVSYGLFLTPR